MNNEYMFNLQKNRIKKVLCFFSQCNYCKRNININVTTINSYDDFVNIPILTKDVFIENQLDMQSIKSNIDKNVLNSFNNDYFSKKDYLAQKGFSLKFTSGSTGKPIEVYKSNNDILKDYVYLNKYRLNYFKNLSKGAFIWVWPTNEYTQEKLFNTVVDYYKVNEYGYIYYLYKYNENSIMKIHSFIVDHHINWITATPFFMESYANFLLDNCLTYNNFEYIECHSEFLYERQKEIIYKVFGVKAVSVYSSNEVQFIGISTKKGNMEVIKENVFMEIIDNEIIVTSLNYFDLPIIRYKIGDLGAWKNDNSSEFELYQFRNNDYILLEDNSKLEPFIISDSVFFMCSKYSIGYLKYYVMQKDYNIFWYYLDKTDIVSQKIEEVTAFLAEYLTAILKTNILVKVKYTNNIDEYIIAGKYKYFQVSEKLVCKHNESLEI